MDGGGRAHRWGSGGRFQSSTNFAFVFENNFQFVTHTGESLVQNHFPGAYRPRWVFVVLSQDGLLQGTATEGRKEHVVLLLLKTSEEKLTWRDLEGKE